MPRAPRVPRLTQPPRPLEDTPPLPPELYKEPTREMLILGEMLYDLELQTDLCRKLPFDAFHYQGNLRIIAGAATRIRLRCERLLGEDKKQQVEGALENLAAAVVREVDREEPGADAFRATAGVDVSAGLSSEDTVARAAESVGRSEQPPPANPSEITEPSELIRKNGAGNPKKTGNGRHSYTAVESIVMSSLKAGGPMTSTELLEHVTRQHTVKGPEFHDALASLRRAKKVTTQQLGRRVLNTIAEGVL